MNNQNLRKTTTVGETKKTRPRLRFAPSPTGSLHVGGARTALFNYLYARAQGGVFVLRIEDTDTERSTDAAVRQVLDSLAWLGIDWDEGPPLHVGGSERGDYGPYTQSKRLPIYKEQLKKLLEAEQAYPCFCEAAELNEKRGMAESMGRPYVYDGKCRHLSSETRKARQASGERHTIRFHVRESEILFDDAVKGKVRFTSDLIGDFVILKSNGYPTYNYAVVVDDGLMEITHVLRGDDHISNTPRQLLLYKALGLTPPEFAHVPMILGPSREKLSKRDGATSLLEFRDEGYYADPLANHLALLGWSPEDGVEIIARADLERAMTKLKFSSAPAIFDYQKLAHFNGHYIRDLDEETVLRDFKAALSAAEAGAKWLSHPRLDELILALRGHCRVVRDIVTELERLIASPKELATEDAVWVETDVARALFDLGAKVFGQNETPFISKEEYAQFIAEAKEKLSLNGKKLFMPLRVRLMGHGKGIDLSTYFELIDRKTICARLQGMV